MKNQKKSGFSIIIKLMMIVDNINSYSYEDDNEKKITINR